MKDNSPIFSEIEKVDAYYENNIEALCEMFYCDERGYPNITVKDVDVWGKNWEKVIKDYREFYPDMSDEDYDYMVYNEESTVSSDHLDEFEEYLKEVEMTYNG